MDIFVKRILLELCEDELAERERKIESYQEMRKDYNAMRSRLFDKDAEIERLNKKIKELAVVLQKSEC